MAETRTAEETGFPISSSACQRYFGFLSQRLKGTAIPEECLTCEKMLDCMATKPETTVVNVESKPALEVAEKVEVPVDVVEEVEETFVVDKPKTITAGQVEKKVEPNLKQQTHQRVEPVEAEKPAAKRSDDDFCVETPGILYNQWSGTVLINKETLQSWGKKVKEVEIQTPKGKKIMCRVFVVPDLATRVIQVPSKLKTDLEIDNGSHVRVKPVTK